jgi:formylglycine-generating enzyme required for sulfatase activity
MNRIRAGIILTATGACAVLAGLSGKVYGTSLSADAGSTSTNGQAKRGGVTAPPRGNDKHGSACPTGLAGPELIFIPGPTPYCIDAREVTQAEYGDFLTVAQTEAPEQSDECKWNSNFEPPTKAASDDSPGGASCSGALDPVGHADEAVRCVDWCDARAYCEWAGKRLCGTVGAAPSTDRTALATSPTLTEWQYACTAGGRHALPYGDTYQKGRCADLAAGDVLKGRRGSSACASSEAPFDKVRDLVGNVFEWTANCDATSEHCVQQGGHDLGASSSSDSCASSGGWAYSHETHPEVGFRCCADAVAP